MPEEEQAEGRVVALTSADLVVAVLAVQRGLLTMDELDQHVDAVLTQRGARKDTSLLGQLLEAELATEDDVRVLKLLRKERGRRCEACQTTTFLLPDQDESNTPCERCGGKLLPREARAPEAADEDDAEGALEAVEAMLGQDAQPTRWIDGTGAKLILVAGLVGVLALLGLFSREEPAPDLILNDPGPGTYRALVWRVASYDGDGAVVELGSADVPNPEALVQVRLPYALIVRRGGAVEQLVKEASLRQAARNLPPPSDLEVERILLAEGGELRLPWLPRLRTPALRSSALRQPRLVRLQLGKKSQSREGLSQAHLPVVLALEDL